ncbi:MAG: hypothetical protein PHI63_01615 [Patescibacteria group bacterium]|nr:hypothetical protein [Patescibacteria group bacterium]
MSRSPYFLLVDTARQACVTVAVVKRNRFYYRRTVQVRHHGAEAVLPAVAALLRRPAMAGGKISGVAVTSGRHLAGGRAAAGERPKNTAVAAGFTHLRAAVVVANALAYALEVRSIGVSDQQSADPAALAAVFRKQARSGRRRVVVPAYASPPHITKHRS